MKNKKVKQMICDIKQSVDGDFLCHFSLGGNGRFKFCNFELGGQRLLFVYESGQFRFVINHAPISLTADQLRGK